MGPNLGPVPVQVAASHAPDIALVFFPRLTLHDVGRLARQAPPGQRLRTGARKLSHWSGNLTITTTQLASNPGAWRDGLWQLPHVGVTIRESDQWLLIEATFPEGVTVQPFEAKLRKFSGYAIVVPLAWPPDLAAADEARAWVKQVTGMPYDTAGAVGSLFDFGVDGPGYFCSKLGAAFLQRLAELPASTRIPWYPRRRLILRELKPEDWLPCELARERGVLDWSKALLVEAA
jgi:hypothetical protein